MPGGKAIRGRIPGGKARNRFTKKDNIRIIGRKKYIWYESLGTHFISLIKSLAALFVIKI